MTIPPSLRQKRSKRREKLDKAYKAALAAWYKVDKRKSKRLLKVGYTQKQFINKRFSHDVFNYRPKNLGIDRFISPRYLLRGSHFETKIKSTPITDVTDTKSYWYRPRDVIPKKVTYEGLKREWRENKLKKIKALNRQLAPLLEHLHPEKIYISTVDVPETKLKKAQGRILRDAKRAVELWDDNKKLIHDLREFGWNKIRLSDLVRSPSKIKEFFNVQKKLIQIARISTNANYMDIAKSIFTKSGHKALIDKIEEFLLDSEYFAKIYGEKKIKIPEKENLSMDELARRHQEARQKIKQKARKIREAKIAKAKKIPFYITKEKDLDKLIAELQRIKKEGGKLGSKKSFHVINIKR